MKQFTVILLAAALLTLGGCSEQMMPPTSPFASSQSGSMTVESSADSPADIPEQTNPAHISAVLENNVTVAAGVTQLEAGTLPGVYQMEDFIFDEEAACRILLEEGWKVNDAIPPAEGIDYFINGEKKLYFSDGGKGGLWMYTGEVSPIVEIWDTTPTDPVEPDFMTREEAVQLAQDTLLSLGLETQLVRCTPLTQEAVSAMVKAYQTKYGGDPATYEKHPPCYVIDLCQTVEGVPICNQDIRLTHGGVDTPSTFAYNPNIQAVVTAEGLYGLSAMHCIQVGTRVQENLDVLSAEEVLAALEKSYEDIINTHPTTIHSVRLQYAVLPLSLGDESRQLRPMWILEGEEIIQDQGRGEAAEKQIRPLTLFFDAVTGQQVEDSYQ